MQLEREQQTLLITLYAKALDNQQQRSILHDDKAEEIMGQLEYPFERFSSYGNGNVMVVRAKQMDAWVSDFLKAHPLATVLNLGCGLDTRVSRINPPASVEWFDVDYPEVIEVRKRFYANRAGYTMVASSITASDWLQRIPQNKPVMVVAEGVLEYLTQDEVQSLFRRITHHFEHGQMVFDVMNSFAVRTGKASLKALTGAEHKWAVDNTEDIDRLSETLQRVADVSVFRSKYTRQLPFKYRVLYGAMSLFPNFRDMIRLLMYKW
ncbi:class I SAM-dependent methyltransferase [Alicyclobacillus cycloheptanicus]|nr:class I SAM-dependent methyltransferase [Alicyclobacillus cycloheptanicus]